MNDRERMVISAHLDAEVEAPWKDKIEEKIARDPAWNAEADVQIRVRAALAAAPEPDFSEARERIKARVLSHLSPDHRTPRMSLTWITAAAAALVVLAASGGYWWGRQEASFPAEVSEIEVQVPRQLELKLSGEGQLMMASTLEGTRR